MSNKSRRASSPRNRPSPFPPAPVPASAAMQKIQENLQQGVNVFAVIGQKETRIATLEQALNSAIEALSLAEAKIKEFEERVAAYAESKA